MENIRNIWYRCLARNTFVCLLHLQFDALYEKDNATYATATSARKGYTYWNYRVEHKPK